MALKLVRVLMSKTRFHALLEEKIRIEVENRSISLANGGASDYPNYRESVGYIRGLQDAVKLCEEIERESE